MNTGIEFTAQEVKAIAFFTAERKWRALMVQSDAKMPHPEVMMYAGEVRICDDIIAKLDTWTRLQSKQSA